MVAHLSRSFLLSLCVCVCSQARISQEKEHFLINAFGLLYREVTAGSLVKVDMQGNIVDRGNTTLGVNKAGFILHAAVHAARPDIKCIIHTHVKSTVIVSQASLSPVSFTRIYTVPHVTFYCLQVGSMKQGLMPCSQTAILVGDVSYHNYQGLFVDEEEKETLARDLGPVNKVMFLRNHGVITCGVTVEEAWGLMERVIAACETQVRDVMKFKS